MPVSRRTLVATTITLVVVLAAGAGYHAKGFRTRPQIQCELPPHDYTPGKLVGPVTAFSAPAVRIAIALSQTEPGEALLFNHFKPSVLAIDQCMVTLESLEIRSNGSFVLKLIAVQNPKPPPDPPLVAVARPLVTPNATLAPPGPILPGASPITKYTDYIKRNFFFVRFRGGSATGRTVPLDINLFPFMVENGQVVRPILEGLDPRIKTYFDAIDRVEIDLSYR